MSTEFDPYHIWLGIPKEQQPPNHYRLLGLREFESDLNVIENAAEQRTLHLRNLGTSQHAAEAQKLLNEVSQARLCLLRPETKQTYDVELRQLVSVPAQTMEPPPKPAGLDLGGAELQDVLDDAAPAAGAFSQVPWAQRRRPPWIVIGVVTAAVIVLILAWVFRPQTPGSSSAKNGKNRPSTSGMRSTAQAPDRGDGTESTSRTDADARVPFEAMGKSLPKQKGPEKGPEKGQTTSKGTQDKRDKPPAKKVESPIPPGPSSSLPDDTTPASPGVAKRQPKPMVTREITLKANQEQGHSLGVLAQGTLIRFAYRGGKWKTWGRRADISPDNTGGRGGSLCLVGIFRWDGSKLIRLRTVPQGTARKPFDYIVPVTGEIRLRANGDEDGPWPQNPGSVRYRIGIQPP